MTMRLISTLLASGGAVLALTACHPTAAGNAAASASAASSAQPAAAGNGAILPPEPGTAPLSSAAQASALAGGLPIQVGQCTLTSVKSVGTRLEGTPGSGSAIEYADGGDQVSYDQVLGIDDSHAGDPIKLCLASLPQNCPAGDDRGKVYDATNLRTGETWSEADSEHSCGGA
jgi:hypothetical protein